MRYRGDEIIEHRGFNWLDRWRSRGDCFPLASYGAGLRCEIRSEIRREEVELRVREEKSPRRKK